MIFNCGPTGKEIVRKRAEWHDFFALFPRVVKKENGQAYCAWLQIIQRRSDPGYDDSWISEYRLKPSEDK